MAASGQHPAESKDDAAPIIADQPAVWSDDDPILDNLSHWHCPHCNAHLYWSDSWGKWSLICLNACHLGRRMQARFQQHMAGAMDEYSKRKEASGGKGTE